MDTEKVFKTKTGYCHILQDKIVLTRDGVIGNVAKVTMGNNIARPLIIYGLISVGLFYLAFKDFTDGQRPEAFLFLVLGLFLLLGIFRSLNNSATPIIERQKIKDIEFKKALSGATRAYFIVRFENESGKIKQRLIMLPGSLSNGKIETEKALEIMKTEFRHIKSAG
jgi:hypothetical protein